MANSTFTVQTYCGIGRGWKTRTANRDRTSAARFLVLLNRVENDRLHKIIAA